MQILPGFVAAVVVGAFSQFLEYRISFKRDYSKIDQVSVTIVYLSIIVDHLLITTDHLPVSIHIIIVELL